MEKKKFEVERYTYEIGGEKYHVYLIPESDREDITGFYIEKDRGGVKFFMVGFNVDKPNVNIEQIIEDNIYDWVYDCEEQISILSTVYDMVLDISFKSKILSKERTNSEE